VSYFGKQLIKAGYNYYGNELMYSGITGTALNADIFIGVLRLKLFSSCCCDIV